MSPSNDRIYLAGQALNGLIQSAMYGGELQRIFDINREISNKGNDKESPMDYTGRIALALADAILNQIETENNNENH